MSLSKNKYITYNNLDDVYNELDALYDIAIEKGFDLGEALYSQALHFVDFCKMFNALPYKSYEDTPKEIVDLFIMINKEIEANQASKIKKNNKGNN